ncbi:hypothetical protein Misp01_50030 [Microtetraspora sp. NBRC 13810]|uniref:helix-turn-helix transcriptional regulator n=1 Tax=Microtetraspora sp. NBRC 13810 TaxID=3030990 RepID=UPI0024A5253B|nr:helix-turn-helix transcriptional regulator [Microtetraspora sp. NBRC 13810]GLW09874.1 hypothetical protein Misp01_50030 [Microtetraspora sp. NBRC 13810]
MTHEVDAAQVYTLLHEDPRLQFEEIVARLDGEPESVRRCLNLLIDLALLRPWEDGGFTVVRPETGMTILLSRAQAQAARSARPAGAAPPGRADGQQPAGRPISPREWQVLQLLAQGCTDEAVGRSMNVSLRTVRRITADLMTRLGAKSRFQAGLRAALMFGERPTSRPGHIRQTHSSFLHHSTPSHGQRRHPVSAS